MLQLTMLTLMCLAFMMFQIKGTSSPLNVIFAYIQNIAFQVELSGFYGYYGRKVNAIITTILGIWDLDFFRFVVPPLCISPSLKAIDCILFQYILAIYPLLFTSVIYFCIQSERFVLCCYPLKRCLSKLCISWDPKRTILHTFATFFLFSYTKVLFTSSCLLLVVHSYNATGQRVPNSAVLFLDPSIEFLHSKHAPYVFLALLILFTCIITPPLLLAMFPTRAFRKCVDCLGFQRWDIFHQVMDVFQGWYKDGTEGTYDYRSFSAFFLVLRIAHGGKMIAIALLDNRKEQIFMEAILVGISQVSMGVLFFIMKPYKKNWMSNVDGLLFTVAGSYILLETFHNDLLNNFAFGLAVVFTILCVVYAFIKMH